MLAEQQRIGRFEIRGLLGRGAQSAVYLGYDGHLEREVAIKTLHFSERQDEQNRLLLAEARTVGKLAHPHIVPIYEAGEADGDPYLVFEYVPGRTLADLLRAEGALPPQRAARLMVQILDAIAYAHEAGIIHRDLKPSNILIDPSGAPRVMDFGIAIRSDAPHSYPDQLMGTPAYMPPEYLSDLVVNPGGDIYSAGLVLFELLFGRRAAPSGSVQEILTWVASGAVTLPATPEVPTGLTSILNKATARNPAQRFASALDMKHALEVILQPTDDASDQEINPAGHSTLEFLLRRMRHKTDFPALSTAISAINRLASSERENLGALSNSILKDFALTNKILRLVNAPGYRTVTGGHVSTISRALVVMGFNTIRNIAISLILLEHLENKGHAARLREEFLRANLCAVLARELSTGKMPAAEVEEAFIGALFHNLGRLLAHYYFPEEAEEVAKLMDREGLTEEAASARVLGLTYADLGIGIARNWGFPDGLVRSMRRLPAGRILPGADKDDRLRHTAAFANAASTILEQEPVESRSADFGKLRARFADALPVGRGDLDAAIERAIKEMTAFARGVGIDFPGTAIGKRVIASEPADAKSTAPEVGGDSTVLAVAAGGVERPVKPAPAVLPQADLRPVAAPDEAQRILASGIEDISNSLVDGCVINEVLQIIVETIYRALGFQRVVLCVRDARVQTMSARFGLGDGVDALVRTFRFRIGGSGDVFNLVLAKGQDLLIQDVRDPKIAGRVPDWYRQSVTARSFLLLPMMVKNAPLALIYADQEMPNGIKIPGDVLGQIRTLRNQAILAMRQATG